MKTKFRVFCIKSRPPLKKVTKQPPIWENIDLLCWWQWCWIRRPGRVGCARSFEQPSRSARLLPNALAHSDDEDSSTSTYVGVVQDSSNNKSAAHHWLLTSMTTTRRRPKKNCQKKTSNRGRPQTMFTSRPSSSWTVGTIWTILVCRRRHPGEF